MKQLLILALSVLLLALAGCGGASPEEGTAPVAGQAAATNEAVEASSVDESSPAEAAAAYETPRDETTAPTDASFAEDSGDFMPFFPAHTAYHPGVILPTAAVQARMDDIVRDLYRQWKARYFRVNPFDDTQAYIHWDGDEGITVSEAHGWGMIILAAMAVYDRFAQEDFDKMLRFYLAHTSYIDPRLMSWKQDFDEENQVVINISGNNSATDGDLDIAYALLMADRLWGSDGEFDYFALALDSINGTMDSIVNQQEWVLTLGDWSRYDPAWMVSTRPSDFMLQHFRSFYAATGDGRWMLLHENILQAIYDLYTRHAPATGLLPNFARLGEDGYFEPTDDTYSWDACRVPWRVAMDFIIHGDERALPMLRTVNAFIQAATEGDPANVRAGYTIADGTPLVPWNSPAFTAPFMVSAMIDAENQEWLDALWMFNATQNTWAGRYYDNTIRLLCMIVASGNWWEPEF